VTARSRRAAVAAPLGTAALALWVVWPILVAKGLPLYQHDWTWSPYAARTVWTWHFLISTWRETGLGEPNSALTLNPLAWAKVLLAALASGRVSLGLYLYFSVWAAVGGVYALARGAIGATPLRASASAALFAATPLLFDKIASGQSSYWAAAAAFIWGLFWCLRSFESGKASDGSRACALFALATIQLHFLAFAWLAYLGGMLAYRRPRVTIAAALGAACAPCLAIPELWFLALRGPEHGADVSPSYRYWVDSQSSYPGDALAMLGYAAKYAEHAAGSDAAVEIVRIAAYSLGLFALGTMVFDRRPAVLLIGGLGVAGVLIAMGAFGPLGAAVTFASLHVSVAQFFREYYHASVLYAIALATLAPAGLARLTAAIPWGGPVRREIAAAEISFLLCGLLGIATWSGGLGRVLPFVAAAADNQGLRAAIAPAEARVLFLPAQQPLEVAEGSIGGNDGTDWVDARRHSVYDFYLSPLIARAEAALAGGDAATAGALIERLGISAVIVRDDVISVPYASAADAGRTRVALGICFGRPKEVAPGVQVFSAGAFPLAGVAAEFRPLPAGLAFDLSPSTAFVDVPGSDAADGATGLVLDAPLPSLGWIRRRDVPSLFARELPGTSYGIVTTRAGATAMLYAAVRGNALVWAPSGLDLGGTVVRSDRPVRVAFPAGAQNVQAYGPAGIAEVGEQVGERADRFDDAELTGLSHDVPWSYRFRLTIAGRAGVVLRESYDPAWRISAPGLVLERHERADGFANAWVVRGHGTYDAVVDYGWQSTGFALLGFSLLAFLAVVRGTFDVRRRAPRPSSPTGESHKNATYAR